jgi:hypothetical protein
MRKVHFQTKAMLFMGVFFIFFANAIVHAQEIEITRADFCLGIKDREPLNVVRDRVRLSANSELFFWMEFQGGQKAIQTLEATGQLLVRHQWRRGIMVTDTIEVGITVDKWLENRDAMRAQVREKGSFTYRTYSYKASWEYDTYAVITLDGKDDAVYQIGSDRMFKPIISLEREE